MDQIDEENDSRITHDGQPSWKNRLACSACVRQCKALEHVRLMLLFLLHLVVHRRSCCSSFALINYYYFCERTICVHYYNGCYSIHGYGIDLIYFYRYSSDNGQRCTGLFFYFAPYPFLFRSFCVDYAIESRITSIFTWKTFISSQYVASNARQTESATSVNFKM